jgi:hypothetical protein
MSHAWCIVFATSSRPLRTVQIGHAEGLLHGPCALRAQWEICMRRSVLAVLMTMIASGAVASDAMLELSGWAEIPSTYRHPGPVSGQFAGPASGCVGDDPARFLARSRRLGWRWSIS